MARHLFLDLRDCRQAILNDPQALQDSLREVLGDNSFVVEQFHRFSPYGVSGVIRTANYCLSIHTWPEYNYAAIDILCYEEGKVEKIAQRVIEKIGSSKPSVQVLERDFDL